MEATQDTTYNGWKNYPTWCVNLWLSNDESLYRRTLDKIEGAREWAEDPDDPKPLRITTADFLRDWVKDDLLQEVMPPATPEGDPAGFHLDLLGYALEQVDWLEIADAWLEQ